MRHRLTYFLLFCLLASCIIADVRWVLRPRENWAGAANVLVLHRTACIIYEPADSKHFYTFFQPSLQSLSCNPAAASVIFVISPYADPVQGRRRTLTQGRVLYDDGPKLIEHDKPPAAFTYTNSPESHTKTHTGLP